MQGLTIDPALLRVRDAAWAVRNATLQAQCLTIVLEAARVDPLVYIEEGELRLVASGHVMEMATYIAAHQALISAIHTRALHPWRQAEEDESDSENESDDGSLDDEDDDDGDDDGDDDAGSDGQDTDMM